MLFETLVAVFEYLSPDHRDTAKEEETVTNEQNINTKRYLLMNIKNSKYSGFQTNNTSEVKKHQKNQSSTVTDKKSKETSNNATDGRNQTKVDENDSSQENSEDFEWVNSYNPDKVKRSAYYDELLEQGMFIQLLHYLYPFHLKVPKIDTSKKATFITSYDTDSYSSMSYDQNPLLNSDTQNSSFHGDAGINRTVASDTYNSQHGINNTSGTSNCNINSMINDDNYYFEPWLLNSLLCDIKEYFGWVYKKVSYPFSVIKSLTDNIEEAATEITYVIDSSEGTNIKDENLIYDQKKQTFNICTQSHNNSRPTISRPTISRPTISRPTISSLTGPSLVDSRPKGPSPTGPSPTNQSLADQSLADQSLADTSLTDSSPTISSPTDPSLADTNQTYVGLTGPSPTVPSPTGPSPTNQSSTNQSSTNQSPTDSSPTDSSPFTRDQQTSQNLQSSTVIITDVTGDNEETLAHNRNNSGGSTPASNPDATRHTPNEESFVRNQHSDITITDISDTNSTGRETESEHRTNTPHVHNINPRTDNSHTLIGRNGVPNDAVIHQRLKSSESKSAVVTEKVSSKKSSEISQIDSEIRNNKGVFIIKMVCYFVLPITISMAVLVWIMMRNFRK